MSSDTIQLNQNYVQNGLGTLTCTIPSTGNYNVSCQCTAPQSISSNDGAGSGRDAGLGPLGGHPGAAVANELSGAGQSGLGQSFPNVPANSAPGVNPTTMAETAPNLPSVALGSGVTGLASGGTSAGAPATNAIALNTVSSSLSIVVKKNGSTIFTAPTLTPTQDQVEFKFSFQATAADSITVVFDSSNANDKTLQAIIANVSVGQGF